MHAFRALGVLGLAAGLSGCYYAEAPPWHYSTTKVVETSISIASGSSVLIDCTKAGEYLIQPTRAPALGLLEEQRIGPQIRFRPRDKMARCTMPGGQPSTAIFYRTPLGAYGTDAFSYDVFSSSGAVARHVVFVHIL